MAARLLQRCARQWFGWSWLLLLCLTPPPAVAQKGWLPGFSTPGPSGWIMAIQARSHSNLIAAGNFLDAGGHLTADYAVRWNGRTWRPLGRGPGLGPRSQVSAALCLPGGKVVLAVTAYTDTSTTIFITRWNGHRWQHLGTGFSAAGVRALTVDAHGNLLLVLYGLRDSPARTTGVLRWNGQSWQPLAPNDPADTQGGSTIYQLLVPSNGDLVASGYFAAGAGQRITGVARWTGTTWQRLGPDVSDPKTQSDLALDAAGRLINLDATGKPVSFAEYSTSGEPSRYRYWDGTAWQPLTTGLTGGVYQLSLSYLTRELFATGRFTLPGDTLMRQKARWDGTRWQPAAPLLGARDSALYYYYHGALAQLPSGEVLVAQVGGLAWLNDNSRQDLANHRRASISTAVIAGYGVKAVTAAPDGSLILSSLAGSRPRQYIVERRQGRHYQPLGSLFADDSFVLAVAPNGDVFAGGDFNLTGPHDSANYVARWNGQRWQPLGTGPPSAVAAMVVAPNGALVAGGSFGVARWNGRSWQRLGPAGRTPNSLTKCCALVVAPSGDILSSGTFTGTDGRRTTGVARWDGSSWQLLRDHSKSSRAINFGFEVSCLALAPNGDIIAGGGIRHIEHRISTTGHVARWNGTSWQAVGPELNGAVNALAVAANGDTVIGGAFEDAGAVDGKGGNPSADYVARWHDGAWQPLGSGLDDKVESLLIAPNGDIVVGGRFTATNDGLAMWHFGIFRDR